MKNSEDCLSIMGEKCCGFSVGYFLKTLFMCVNPKERAQTKFSSVTVFESVI